MTTDDNEFSHILPSFFYCEICDFKCFVKRDFNRHINTQKHKNNILTTFDNEFYQKKPCIKKYTCQNCNKDYKDRAGLWRHNKKCNSEDFYKSNNDNKTNDNKTNDNKTNDNKTNDNKDELIEYLIKENKEIKELILELAKKDTYSHCTTNNNSHNKTFNLQFFLNETCKDAMNIMDFVNSIQLQLGDLEKVGELGFVEGISNIITTNLKALDITQRPVHCADKKREVIYIKDEDKWEKEDEEKIKLRKAIKKVATKNMCLLPKFKEAYPDCSKASSKYSDQYNKIIVESCGGSGDNDVEKENKIIKNIAKNVIIDKSLEKLD